MPTQRILGLDLGSNSIGWALLDKDAGRVLAAGVRVFPEGVDRDKQGGELSKNETRRVARGMRRQIVRRAKRKRKLRRILAQAGLLPQDGQTDVFGLDPYDLRRRALAERLEPFHVGRALLHLNQRRGFLSNRKADKAAKKETSDMLKEISQLQADIEKAGHKTLGEHLAAMNDNAPLLRVRGRHTRRDMYEKEFDAVWSAQKVHHPELLTDELRAKVRHAIFFQRPLRIPKSLIGTCELETGRRRCPRADRRAQRFRMLQEVNNLRLIDARDEERALTADERTKLLDYLAQYDKRTFDQIRDHLGLLESVRFNFERGERKSLFGMPTDKALAHKDLFGKAWHDRDEEQKNHVVRSLLEEDEPTVLRRATTEWELSPEQAERVAAADLQPGYMSFCREAIGKLLPHLAKGLPLMADDNTPCALTEAGYLRPDQREIPRLERLPQPPDLPNPIVRQALHEVRKVVNAIVSEHGRPDRIHIEMAREVKGSLEQRQEYTWKIREREAERDRAADKIREAGQKPTRETINKYLLWQEQAGLCVYSGRNISMAQLLGGEVDVDHILPKARSLDDSMMNKVVCFRSANAEKGDRTPYEWLAASEPARYDEVCQRARKLPHYGKYRKFLQKNVELDDFINRQLNDTAYITKAVRQYLQCLVEHPHDILCTKGQLTAELRHEWGLNTILRDDGLNLKNREDHRHHAVDAVVIAFTDRSTLQYLAREGAAPPARPEFRDEVAELINSINVSHRVQRGISGALHEETIYGPTAKPGEFSYRKLLTALTANEVENIRDPAVRAKVLARLKQFNVEPGRGKARIPAEAWKEPLWMSEDKKIPIHKVRLVKRDKTIQPIRNGSAHVKPGSMHHLCIFVLPDGSRDAVFVTMIEAARRAAMGAPIIRRKHPESDGAEFVMSLSRGEMVLGQFQEKRRLVRLAKVISTNGRLFFVEHTDARPATENEKLGIRARQLFPTTANLLKARKVTVDTQGRIRWAHD